VLVEVADLRRREFVHARPALVHDQKRQDVMPGQGLGDPLDVLGERRRNVRLALSQRGLTRPEGGLPS
jgi:hypothetical protein